MMHIQPKNGLGSFDQLNIMPVRDCAHEKHGIAGEVHAISRSSSADELIVGSEPQKKVSGPVGKARWVFEEVSKLLRHQQQKIVRVVKALLIAQGAKAI